MAYSFYGTFIQVGSPVYFYDSTGQVVRGVVEYTNRMADVSKILLFEPLRLTYYRVHKWLQSDVTAEGS